MLISRCAALSVLLLGAAESNGGHSPLALDGNSGFARSPMDAPVVTALGLGSQGPPSGRLACDMGVSGFAGSGSMSDAGTGTLPGDFGGSSFASAGATVTDLEWSKGKALPAFDDLLEPVTISRGFAADYFASNLEVSEGNGRISTTVELEAPAPIALLRGAADFGVFRGPEEVGCTEVEIDDVQAKLLDVETVLTVHATSLLDLFVGYRTPELAADDLLGDPFDTDVAMRGLVIGGGLRF